MESKDIKKTEQLDDLDKRIIHELGEQARLRAMMQMWEARRRATLRRKLIPIVSNIISVAALMVLGLILQTMIPGRAINTQIPVKDYQPKIEQTTEGTTDKASLPSHPADSLLPEESFGNR